ncbi:glycosyltransferase family 4 protein [Polaribacter porphyrae]|uniref:Glycosyl transferase family 1 domain-containing protein n=1 Tax=Polaribacter porphyrae TaxID=1137780 RepID=A0A2S7WP10_9FLAO|nr:glycosyltransferase [Polaribacter porphyrae]PQJ79347.1 hypothetical protein BTO18_09245 [Polaribacter porphyrae]
MYFKKSHIVFLTPGFARSDSDSTTIPALQVYLKKLKKQLPNTRMTLITFQFPFVTKKYDWNGIQVIPLNGNNKRYKKFWTWKKALKTLKKLHQQKPITVIHSFWIGECSFIASRFSEKNNIKHINTVMGQDANLGNRYAKSLKNSCTDIITLSENQKNKLLKNHNLKSQIIPWDLDTKKFPKLQKSTLDILGVGSLNEIKNYSLFVNIISELVKKFPNLKVEIIGEGVNQKKLEKQIITFNLTKNIKLIGLLPRLMVLEKMSEAKILLHTSSFESFGFVFLEALYAGMQIVSFDVGLAKPTLKWRVCKTENEMIEACKRFLIAPKKEKNRMSLIEEKFCISSYIKLYDA